MQNAMNDITRLAFIIIAAAALVSCGSPAPQSVLFGEIAAVHTRWTAAQKRHKAAPVAAVCRAPFEADRVVISAGETMRAEAFGIDASMADACLGATMLRVRLAD